MELKTRFRLFCVSWGCGDVLICVNRLRRLATLPIPSFVFYAMISSFGFTQNKTLPPAALTPPAPWQFIFPRSAQRLDHAISGVPQSSVFITTKEGSSENYYVLRFVLFNPLFALHWILQAYASPRPPVCYVPGIYTTFRN